MKIMSKLAVIKSVLLGQKYLLKCENDQIELFFKYQKVAALLVTEEFIIADPLQRVKVPTEHRDHLLNELSVKFPDHEIISIECSS